MTDLKVSRPARRLSRSLLPVGALALTAYITADPGSLLVLVCLPALVVCWLATGSDPRRAAPRVVINVLLAAGCGWAGLRVLEQGLNVRVFSEFVSVLLVLKTLDRRRARDSAQAITLAIFLVVGSILTSNGLWTAACITAFIPVVTRATLLFQLVSARERAAAASEPPESRRGPPVNAITATFAVLALPVTLGIFVLMPRQLGTQAFGAWGNASAGRVVGFNDEIELGRPGLISESPAPVLDLTLLDREGKRIGGIGQRFYLRGSVLDRYDAAEQKWVRSVAAEPSNLRGSLGIGTEAIIPVMRGERSHDLEQRITIRNAPRDESHLFAVYRPTTVAVDARVRVSEQTGEIRVPGRGGRISYTVYSDQFGPALPTEAAPRSFTASALEPAPQAIADLAGRILSDDRIPLDPGQRSSEQNARAASLIERFFTREGFGYSLDIRAAPANADPIQWFLFEEKAGHCEYFAAAGATLCHAVGLNTRVVTGYVATDYHEASQHYIVRASNAHAWFEVEIEPGVWRRFDATPAGEFARLHEPSRSMLAGFRRIIESIEYAWIRSVVAFDSESRRSLLGGSTPMERVLSNPQVDGWASRVTHGSPQYYFGVLARGSLVGGAAAVVVALVIAAAAALGARPTRPSEQDRRAAVRAGDELARAIDRRLTRAGARRPIHIPLTAHVRDALRRDADRDLRSFLLAACRHLDRTVYASDPPDPEETTALTSAVLER